MRVRLPGFGQGTALASALPTAAAQIGSPVYDKGARNGLRKLELELADDAPLFYAKYMRLIEECRAEGRRGRESVEGPRRGPGPLDPGRKRATA